MPDQPATPPKFLNRELSWLEFNQRVLDEARDESLPTLERLKFLAITSTNLDEFFMVRVGGLHVLLDEGMTSPDPSGVTPAEQLAAVGKRVRQLVKDQYACFMDLLEPKLAEAGIKRLRPAELNDRQARSVEQIFDNEIFSVLTPMAVRSREDFPLVVNLTLNVCVQLAPAADAPQTPRFAVMPLGRALPRMFTLGSDRGHAFILLEDVVTRHLNRFFAGEEIIASAVFRITRNADFVLRDDLAPDLLSGMEGILAARKHGQCVRLEIGAGASSQIVQFLAETLQIDESDVFLAPGPADLGAFMPLADRPGFEALKYEPWPPQAPPEIEPGQSLFDVLSRRDVLLYHPYQSFEPVQKLVEEAAADPDVLAIKQILYRTSRASPIVAALARAAQRGKHVTAIVELKARFDEARNIEWAKSLEEAGVQVIYGIKGLKTHAKVCIIVRREPHGIVRYCHFGTGNYNEITARIYSDASLLTSNEELGADAVSFYSAIAGYSQPQRFRKIEAAPLGLRQRLLELIEGETHRKQQGQQAAIDVKVNSLIDQELISALYAASQAGVRVRLNVRGVCCLRPGVKDLSENISVISIVDRFLEHARILRFHHGGDDLVFISSADWMPRNIDRRIELLVPIEDPASRSRLISILETYFDDSAKARELSADGSYHRVKSRRKRRRSQELLYEEACRLTRQAEQSQQTTFEPHRAPEET
jgi:polyphosphate kinase